MARGGPTVARQPVAMVLLVLLLAGACTAGGASTMGQEGAGPAGNPTIAARDLAFDRSELVVPAGQAFSLTLDNRDSAPHNVSIAVAKGSVVFAGQIFSGPAIRHYQVPAIEAGRYAFRCDVHPGMAGEVIAREVVAVGGPSGP